ncbi:hypothetical protein [Mangrovibacterium lignilyticum]|uniref:hypothetical protein n=1 Tax=Mangrovibacterium lignilyticum TaxID=2668052 RepID=UPI0013D3B5E8|nr:hypothetical protein [Mangrovibacterium lignilyticum]
MKALLKLMFLLAGMGLAVMCSESDIIDEDLSAVNLKSAQPITVTLPFEANFVNTFLEETGPNPICGEWDPENGQFWMMIYGEGEGTATHMGKITHHFEFCNDWVSGIYPGPSGYMKGYFVAANGDSLFIHVEGQVLDGRLDHHPEDVIAYFTDPWEILGGTGRFEGASGHGMTDDYVREPYPDISFHHYTGEITLVKGKR